MCAQTTKPHKYTCSMGVRIPPERSTLPNELRSPPPLLPRTYVCLLYPLARCSTHLRSMDMCVCTCTRAHKTVARHVRHATCGRQCPQRQCLQPAGSDWRPARTLARTCPNVLHTHTHTHIQLTCRPHRMRRSASQVHQRTWTAGWSEGWHAK